jgi:hypothetical protein
VDGFMLLGQPCPNRLLLYGLSLTGPFVLDSHPTDAQSESLIEMRIRPLSEEGLCNYNALWLIIEDFDAHENPIDVAFVSCNYGLNNKLIFFKLKAFV